jgi:hypothetical protein
MRKSSGDQTDFFFLLNRRVNKDRNLWDTFVHKRDSNADLCNGAEEGGAYAIRISRINYFRRRSTFRVHWDTPGTRRALPLPGSGTALKSGGGCPLSL